MSDLERTAIKYPDSDKTYAEIGRVMSEPSLAAVAEQTQRSIDQASRLLDSPFAFSDNTVKNASKEEATKVDPAQAAEALLTQALEERRSKLGENSPFTAEAMHELGKLYCRRKNDFPKGEEYFEKEMAIFEQLGSRSKRWQRLDEINSYYLSAANSLLRKGDLVSEHKAALILEKDFELMKKLGSSMPSSMKMVGLALVNIYKKGGAFDKADQLFSTMIKAGEMNGNSADPYVYLEYGDFLISQGRLKEAEKQAKRLRTVFGSNDDQAFEAMQLQKQIEKCKALNKGK